MSLISRITANNCSSPFLENTWGSSGGGARCRSVPRGLPPRRSTVSRHAHVQDERRKRWSESRCWLRFNLPLPLRWLNCHLDQTFHFQLTYKGSILSHNCTFVFSPFFLFLPLCSERGSSVSVAIVSNYALYTLQASGTDVHMPQWPLIDGFIHIRDQEAQWVTFFNFSSAFNTLWPFPLEEKLSAMQVDHDMVAWVTDYITNRPQ